MCCGPTPNASAAVPLKDAVPIHPVGQHTIEPDRHRTNEGPRPDAATGPSNQGKGPSPTAVLTCLSNRTIPSTQQTTTQDSITKKCSPQEGRRPLGGKLEWEED